MNCRICGKSERITEIGGIKLTNMAQYMQICADCINAENEKIRQEEIALRYCDD